MGRLVLLLSLCGTVLAQGNQATFPSADGVPAAMEQSLAQQEAAVDAFREGVQLPSIAAQRQSIASQVKTLEPEPRNASAGFAGGDRGQMASSASSDFFAVAWPGALPLAVPNVQMPYLACGALDPREVDKLVQEAAGKHGLDSALLKSVMKQESAFKPCAVSVAGAMGLMQIMPDTAEMLHLDDPFNPAKNVDAGAKFLKTMLDRFGGDVAMALAAYNAGPTSVDKAGGIPPIAETLQYVSNILGNLPIAY